MKRLLLLSLGLILLTISCKKEETVEPSPYGKLTGTITEFETDSLISKANVFTQPATSYVTTDTNGQYTIYNIQPGEYTVTAAKSGYDTLKVGVTIIADKTTEADFILHESDSLNNQKYGSITGKIIDAITSSPVENANVYTSPATVVLLSDNNGNFKLEHLSPQTYLLKVEKAGYDSTSISVNVEAGFESVAQISLVPTDTTTPPQFAQLEGYVINSVTEEPVNNALISGTPSFGTVFTDSNGYYKITNLTPGSNSISVSKTFYQTTSADISLNAGDFAQLNFTLVPTVGNIDGTVIDSTGSPLPQVIITTSPETGSFLTDNNGNFKIQNITAGEISVTADKSGYTSKTVTINVEAGLTTQVVIMLTGN